ncbi:uncharacterized protein TRAVEDRAFT_167296 [Trametes versicolor FP-101664 SS1]|uniref:uncharacterized protein n=1 Tax=Trametes versicolor (strain FP-101664) TaxID=717944 RepID=UPI0004621896|nr:uncharacterized protein TRAVEDRAFT_167296 [Trametes versicolor FP-101664 SS1]EIW59775.1 hypothetical protein TRAVEDRAFT_167296 [Trametes versicolor FP-101664 SS1]
MSAVVSVNSTFNTSVNAPVQAPAYSFLAHPPPQKKRPTQPLPSPPVPRLPSCAPSYPRRRSATTSAVAAWVAAVQPGSPAPRSPRRRSSISSARRSSGGSPCIVSRRPSVNAGTPHSASFLSFSDSPTAASRIVITPSIKDFKPDLTAVGYTSVFVHFPETPHSATVFTSKTRPPLSPQRIAPRSPSSPVRPVKGLKSFRSLSALRPTRRIRSKSITMRGPPSPPLNMSIPAKKSSAHAKASRAQESAAVSASKKSKYAKFRPPPLATELALAQLADGGSIEDHIRRFAEAQARAGGATEMTRDGRLVGVSDVYRDGAGGVWRDQDEEWEYAHLLGGDDEWCESEDGSWVRFGSPTKAARKASVVVAGGDVRRGSVSSQDSDLDPRYAMRAEDEGADDLARFGSALAPACARRPGMSVLAIPARTRRTAKHLRKPEFLLDAFPVPSSPTSTSHHHAPQAVQLSERQLAAKQQRRRPAPLTLTPPSPAFKCPMNPLDADRVRDDFLASSFAPAHAPRRTHSAQPQPQPQQPIASPAPPRGGEQAATIVAKKPAVKNVRGFLRAMGMKKGDL